MRSDKEIGAVWVGIRHHPRWMILSRSWYAEYFVPVDESKNVDKKVYYNGLGFEPVTNMEAQLIRSMVDDWFLEQEKQERGRLNNRSIAEILTDLHNHLNRLEILQQ